MPWDITQERPGYHIRATVAFRDMKADDYAAGCSSGVRALEYLRYDQGLVARNAAKSTLPETDRPCVCHGIEILTAADLHSGPNRDDGGQVCPTLDRAAPNTSTA
ncbi:MAG: hypothetical protein R3C99_18135 [Pirellulaceae bacterium]